MSPNEQSYKQEELLHVVRRRESLSSSSHENNNDSFLGGMEEFFGLSSLHAFPPNIVLEIVSARGLKIPSVDPYCTVRIGSMQVHRTKTIQNDSDPIWTVKTGSLTLLNIPEDKDIVQEARATALKEESSSTSVVIEIHHGLKCIGFIAIPFHEVLKKKGVREEFAIQSDGKNNDKELVSEP